MKKEIFELTNAQNRAIEEILSDLRSQEPMQRLLQGDVGSGKTVVAIILAFLFYCMLAGAISSFAIKSALL